MRSAMPGGQDASRMNRWSPLTWSSINSVQVDQEWPTPITEIEREYERNGDATPTCSAGRSKPSTTLCRLVCRAWHLSPG